MYNTSFSPLWAAHPADVNDQQWVNLDGFNNHLFASKLLQAYSFTITVLYFIFSNLNFHRVTVIKYSFSRFFYVAAILFIFGGIVRGSSCSPETGNCEFSVYNNAKMG